ncbi:hypothetical protein RhiLY_03719 [Ceratobasidium sp. AG-Ba]|nr:hypothetical protein RhiLY_03719 [Ceratobasidium sp. AG-Ba]
MSDSTNFQPRSEFVRSDNKPQSYALVALNGTDTLRCHGVSPAALTALREVFGDDMRLYGENAENHVAEFVFRNSPWSNKSVRSETLITNMFAVLLIHQYTFLTAIDYGRQYLDKLSLTFTRPTSISNPAPATESVFALSFTAPTTLRVVAAPLHATPAILQSVRGTWPRGVKSERKLGNGSWEFRLRGFGYFSSEKTDEAVLPHVFTLLRVLDSHAFKLLAAVPIGGRSRAKDLWLFSAPGASRPGRSSPGGSGSVQGSASNGATSPYQATIDSSEPYSPGPFSPASPSHAKYATDQPERAVPLASGHARNPSLPTPGTHRKPAPVFVPSPGHTPPAPGPGPTMPSPMTMPVPVIAQPVPPPSPRSNPNPPSPRADPSAVPVPIPVKRNSSLLRKFRGNGRTSSGGFKHPPPPPGFKAGGGSMSGKSDTGSVKSKRDSMTGKGSFARRGHGRQRSLASGEIIYETPTPQKSVSPSPNATPNPPGPAPAPAPASPTSPSGFVAPPPPPPLPQSPVSPISPALQSPVVMTPEIQAAPMPVPAITTTSPSTVASPLPQPRPDVLSSGTANRTTEELLLPRGAFRDSAFSTNTDMSHDVAIVWTGKEDPTLGGVKEEELEGEVEVRSPDVEGIGDARPKSEKAELAIVEPGPPPPLPTSPLNQVQNAQVETKDDKPPVKSSTPNEWVFVSVDKGKGSESSGSPPEETTPSPAPDVMTPPTTSRKGSFKRWFGGGTTQTKPQPKPKPRRRRGGMAQALRSSKRLTIE